MPRAQAADGGGRDVPAATMHADGGDRQFFFDIPAQPLADALQRYAMISSRPALFSSAQVDGLVSSAVRGDYPPEIALDLLLQGTGLAAQRARTGPAEAFILRPSVTAARAGTASAAVYGGRVQSRIWKALCANPSAQPGRYRTLLRFEIDTAGALRHVRLLTSTGDRRRDAAVLGALDGLRMDLAPPAGMEQPLTMILLPRDARHPDDAPACAEPEGRP